MASPEKQGKELVRHLSWLARINVTEEEAEQVLRDLEELKKLVDRVLEAPVEDVEPLYHPLDLTSPLREDEPGESLSQEEALANAAETEKGFVKAPRTVEG